HGHAAAHAALRLERGEAVLPREPIEIDVLIVRDERRHPIGHAHREAVGEPHRSAEKLGLGMRHDEFLGGPAQVAVKMREAPLALGEIERRLLARELPRQFTSRLPELEDALERPGAANPPRLVGKEDLPHAGEIDFRRDAVFLLGPVGEVDVAIDVRPRAVRDEIDVFQQHLRALQLEARGEVRAHGQEAAYARRAFRELRAAEDGVEVGRAHERKVQVRADNAPIADVVLVDELAVVRVHRHALGLETLRTATALPLEIRQARASLRPVLNGHPPSVDVQIDVQLAGQPHESPPWKLDRDLLCCEERPVARRRALDPQVLDHELSRREERTDSPDVQRPLQELRTLAFSQRPDRLAGDRDVADVDAEDCDEKRCECGGNDDGETLRPAARGPAPGAFRSLGRCGVCTRDLRLLHQGLRLPCDRPRFFGTGTQRSLSLHSGDYSTTTSRRPLSTDWPSVTATSLIRPALGAPISFSIFMASITTRPWRAPTSSPGFTRTRRTRP